jgi:hypothetical protein
MSSLGNTISEGNQGPTVDIAIWICLVISGLTVLSKILMKLGRHQDGIRRLSLGSDDFVLPLTMVKSPNIFHYKTTLMFESLQQLVSRWPCLDRSRWAWVHTTTKPRHLAAHCTSRLDMHLNFSMSRRPALQKSQHSFSRSN